jgi:energy-coupling factor transporter ATP-binding protein EcfA2
MQTHLESLETEVKLFANQLPYWGKYLGDKILSGATIGDAEINTTYSYLLEELELIPKTENPELIFSTTSKSSNGYKADLILSKLSDVEGVNALCANQTIEFSPNLTIIYGTNGCGKSGYTRLLKKAFYSKAPEEIQPNIHLTTGHKSLSAKFSFTDESSTYELKFPLRSSNPEFLQFSVFDGKSVLKHLEGKNSFEFRPSGLNFFGAYIESLKKIELKLNADVNCKQILNVFTDLFEGTSPVKVVIENLSAKTDMTNLKKYIPFLEEDINQKLVVQKDYDERFMASKNKEKEVARLASIKQLIVSNKQAISNLNRFFTEEVIKKTYSAIEDFLNKEKIAKKEGVKSFTSEQIKEIGSQEWKSFIDAAEKFALKQAEKYPITGDACILCQQPLSIEAQALINNYWLFIKSVAESEAKSAQEIINKEILSYQNLSFTLFPEENILSTWLLESHPLSLERFKLELSKLKQLSVQIIAALTSKSVASKAESLQIATVEHDRLISLIDERSKSLNENKESEELSVLDAQLRFLLHKEKLSLHIDKIEKYVEELKWVEKSKKVNWGKRNVTEEEKRLSAKYFNQKYVDAFNDECLRLKGNFGILINHTGAGGTSFRQLLIKGKNPAVILSEGEQKIIAIADFIAEMKLSEINAGIIFDDPVTSLDHERKESIALRLVEEAQSKQVIVFTHDITFLLSLKYNATNASLTHSSLSVFKTGDLIGVTRTSLPWIASNVSDRNGYLKNELQRIGKVHRTSDPEAYRFEVKAWCGLLREAWERCVEERLFKGVVSRHSYGVETQKLKNVVVTKDLIDNINDGMTKSSKWVHDQAAGQNSPTPNPDELGVLMDDFEDFIKNKCKAQ